MNTDSQEPVSAALDTLPMAEYNAARDAEAKPKAAEETQVQTKETEVKPAAATVKADPPKVEAHQESEQDKPGQGKSSYAKLRARIREQDAVIEALRKPAEKTAERIETRKADDDPEPKLSDAKYATGDDPYERWVKDQARWEARQEFKSLSAKSNQAEQQQAAQEEEAQLFADHNKRLEAIKSEVPDFDELVEAANENDVKIPPAVGRALIELENSERVVIHLLKNPDVVEKLNNMKSIESAIAEIGRISERLITAAPKPKEEAPKEEAPKEAKKEDPVPPKPKPVSQAPAPITPVGGSSTKSAVDPEKMSMAEYNSWRDSQGARR